MQLTSYFVDIKFSSNFDHPFIFVESYMTKLTALVIPCLFATSAFASTERVYFAKNDSIESQVCVAAANQGLAAAKELGAKHGIRVSRVSSSLYCNGQDIRDIAKNVTVENANSDTAVSLYAKNNQRETQLCLEAAQKGLSTLSLQHLHCRKYNLHILLL